MSNDSPLLSEVRVDSANGRPAAPTPLSIESPAPTSRHHPHNDNDSNNDSDKLPWKTLFRSNLPPLARLATPVVLTYVLQYTLNLTNLIFIGHISAEKLAAAALGIMFVNVTGYAVALGFATAVDTLCSQAYGAGSLKLMGLVAQRAAVMLMFICIPIVVVWWYSADLLILLRQNPEISRDAGAYVWRLSYSLIPYVWFEISKKYLINQQKLRPLLYVMILTNVINVLLVYLYINVFDMGFIGGPTATMTAQWLMLIMTVLMCHWKGYHRESWPALNFADIFSGWKPIFKLGAAGSLMLCAEWWAFEAGSLIAGWVSEIVLDAFVVLLQVQSLMFMIPMGIGVAVSTITGNHLGAGRPREAKYAGTVSIALALATQSVIASIFFAARYQVGALFSNDDRVIQLVADVAPVTAVMLVFDALQAVASGILRGVGLQSIGAVTNLIGYYAIGIPIAVLMVFHYHLHVYGLVTGLLISVLVTTATFFGAIFYVDWRAESNKAVSRVKADKANARDLNPELVPPTPVFAVSTPATPSQKMAEQAFEELSLERRKSEGANEPNGHHTSGANGHTLAEHEETKQMPV